MLAYFFLFFFRSTGDDVYISVEHQTLCAQTFLYVLQQPFLVSADDQSFCKVDFSFWRIKVFLC